MKQRFWSPVNLPFIAERFIAFSIPDERHFLAISYEAVHEIVFAPQLAINSDFSRPEGKGVFNGREIVYQGIILPTFGLFGGNTLVVDSTASVVSLKPPHPPNLTDDGVVEVRASDGQLIQSLPFPDRSGDWQQVTYSTDFRHILIGAPYEIALYRRT